MKIDNKRIDITPEGEKVKLGRPRRVYKKIYGNKAKLLFAQGYSKWEIAAELDISWISWERWEKEEPHFIECMRNGEALAKAWWMAQGRDGVRYKHGKSTVNFNIWKAVMNYRFDMDDDKPKGGSITSDDIALLIEGAHKAIERQKSIKVVEGTSTEVKALSGQV